ncbi:MAG TPA: zinc-ribbon domain-containing protein [Microbacterium sp.]|nr:zinc-ribbon domain-containing protein [Microbacterium sp.]
MFLLFGTRPYESQLHAVTFVCPHCGVNAGQSVRKVSNRFTLFFVLPLFSLGTQYFVECSNCRTVTPLTRQQAEHSLQWAAGQLR